MIYKALFYRLFKSIEQLGGGDIPLRANGLLSLIVGLNFAFVLSIISKTTEREIGYAEIILAVFLFGIFILNYILFTRKKRYLRIFEELELAIPNIGFLSKVIVSIAISLTIIICAAAILI